MSKDHIKIGQFGEQKAVEMLKGKGYRILKRNERNKYGEIDIIAMDGKVMVFVEVRTKTGTDFGSPEESINYRKKKRLIRNAKGYVKYNGVKNQYRIDAVCIVLDENMEILRIRHYKNITLF